jgi:hypothetical protein
MRTGPRNLGLLLKKVVYAVLNVVRAAAKPVQPVSCIPMKVPPLLKAKYRLCIPQESDYYARDDKYSTRRGHQASVKYQILLNSSVLIQPAIEICRTLYLSIA